MIFHLLLNIAVRLKEKAKMAHGLTIALLMHTQNYINQKLLILLKSMLMKISSAAFME